MDSRFELRIVGGAAVVVQKGEHWQETKPAAAPAPAGGAASSSPLPARPAGGAASSSVAKTYAPSPHSLEERYELCRSVGEECIQEEELRALLKIKPNPVCYDGFEPSGRMHIAQGILKAILVNRLTASVRVAPARAAPCGRVRLRRPRPSAGLCLQVLGGGLVCAVRSRAGCAGWR